MSTVSGEMKPAGTNHASVNPSRTTSLSEQAMPPKDGPDRASSTAPIIPQPRSDRVLISFQFVRLMFMH